MFSIFPLSYYIWWPALATDRFTPARGRAWLIFEGEDHSGREERRRQISQLVEQLTRESGARIRIPVWSVFYSPSSSRDSGERGFGKFKGLWSKNVSHCILTQYNTTCYFSTSWLTDTHRKRSDCRSSFSPSWSTSPTQPCGFPVMRMSEKKMFGPPTPLGIYLPNC